MSTPLLSPAESYFALSRILSWADGEQQDAEQDALTTLRMVESLNIDVYDKTLADDDEALFKTAILALENQAVELRARACAWMLKTAMVAHEGSLTQGEVNWAASLANVSEAERNWITRTQKALHVVESDMDSAFKLIPRIRRID